MVYIFANYDKLNRTKVMSWDFLAKFPVIIITSHDLPVTDSQFAQQCAFKKIVLYDTAAVPFCMQP